LIFFGGIKKKLLVDLFFFVYHYSVARKILYNHPEFMRNKKKILFLSDFFKTLALKISDVNGGKKNILIFFDVKIYREQVHMNLLIFYREI